MNTTLRYYLNEVKDWTDKAIIPQDKGMNPNLLPFTPSRDLFKAGLIKKNKRRRWVVTQKGRDMLKSLNKEAQNGR